MGDFASLMNLFPTRKNESVESVIGENSFGFHVLSSLSSSH